MPRSVPPSLEKLAAEVAGTVDTVFWNQPAMHETADQFVQHLFDLYGPFAVFGLLVIAGVGLHLPEDLIVIPAGWEIASGQFPVFWTILAAYLGVTGGDTLWFLVCRKFGGRLVGTHWFRKQAHPKRILQVKALYDRHGLWVLLVSRFIPGSRTVGVAVGGLVHLSWTVFLLVEFSTAILSVGFQLGLGYAAQRGLSTSGPLHWIRFPMSESFRRRLRIPHEERVRP
jgi:membrane protein DedA with SNARE-associated domain